jgi:hypothetical protein
MIVGLSVGVLVGLAGTSACSSTSTNDEQKGGTGAVITAGTGGSTAAGAAAGGTANNPSGGTGGGAVVGCPGMPVTCLDATSAQACNPSTNMVETVVCKEEFAKSGLISNGCTTDATGSGCAVDGGENETCWTGAQGIAVCAELDDNQFIGVYVDCFNDDPDIRPLLTCIADFVDTAAKLVDCDGAEAACLPDGAGGAPTDGAGGAPDGAGGAP